MKTQLGRKDIFKLHATDVQEQNTIEPNKVMCDFSALMINLTHIYTNSKQ